LAASGNPDGQSVLQSFRELQVLRTPGPADKTPSAAARLAQIVSEARREPEPVRSMLLTLAAVPGAPQPTQQVSSSTALSLEIGARLAVPCLQLVAGRFPFDRRAERDAPLRDFARLFAPKGSFDEVFRQLLATRVDTSSQTWQTLSTAAGPSPADLERFRSAARIRQVFFAHGGPQAGLQLTVLPVDLDEDVDRFQLEVDGQIVRYAHGPVVPSIVKWPGPQGHARIELTPASAAGTVDYTGPWTLFRLLDHAAIREDGPPGHFRVVFDVGGKHASFDVGSDTGANPFRLRELEQFQCPISGQ
jgi:type VI secretion system protein ImpL